MSVRTDYAVRALLCLADADPELLQLGAICAEQALPRKFAEAILGDLRRAGLVDSKRGPNGGYSLAIPAERITLAAVLRAVDLPLAELRGLLPDARTQYTSVAAHVPELWNALRASLDQVLEQTTLAQVLSGALPEHVRALTGPA